MKSLSDFLQELHHLGITLWDDEGYLAYDAPDDEVLTAELLAELKERKAEILQLLMSTQRAERLPTIPKTQRNAPIPLSYAQQRLWFLEELGSGVAYNMPAALEIEGKLDVIALQQTLSEIVRRHEILRSTFAMQKGNIQAGLPQQVIQPAIPFDLPVIDLRSLAQEQQTNEITRLTQAEALKPFDLTQDLTLRAQLLQLAEGRFRLLMTMHHIASDGWSLGVLVRELTTLYTGYAQGRPSPLPELPIQYADFAIWQRNYLQGEVLERQLLWWKEQLAGVPTLLHLPSDRSRPAQQSFRGSAVAVQIEAGLTQQLRQLSWAQGCTLYMILLAAFQVLLHCYTGQEQIVVGSPIANRNHQELEGLIGFFVNTMALRANLTGNPRFLEVLAQVQSTTQAAYEHQDLPFERLVEELNPDRNLTYNPIVQVLFALQNAPMDAFTLPEVQITPATSEVKTTRFDMEMHLWEVGDTLNGYCVYATDLFDKSTIERIAGHFQTLLAGIVANPDQHISDLPLLTEAERQQLLVEWNDTTVAYSKDECIHHLFEEQAARTPDAVAVVSPKSQVTSHESPILSPTTCHFGLQTNDSLTYAELNERANQLAHYLQGLGVMTNDRVGLCFERSPEMIVALLAILKAGAGYVPFDPTYPAERLTFMAEDANIRLLLTNAQLRTRLTWAENLTCLTDWATLDQQPKSNPASCATPETLVYCLYTSGSTGLPKGVLMPHRAINNLIQWQMTYTTVARQARTLQYSPLNFDVSCQEIFATLCAGGVLVLVDEEQRRDPDALLDYLEQQKVERLYLPFVALQQLAEAADGHMPATLQEINTAGEQLQITPAIAHWFRQSNCRLQNHYGPTETHVVTAWPLPLAVDDWPRLPPIGRPVANTQIYILDVAQQPTPIGIAGELYIAGIALADGYNQRPDLTNERFVASPFGQGRLYKTGDLARWRADGTIEYLGRIDQQVKIRGFRIELGEVEALLNQHPAVQEAVVIAREDTPGDKRLAAYVVSSQKSGVSSPESNSASRLVTADLGHLTALLRSHLQAKLPDYMLPSAFVLLDALPLTPNGKVDRKALPAPDLAALLSTQTFVAPRTSTERTLADIWAAVLGLEQIGVEDNFFALGGHSLLATQVVSRIRQALTVDVPLRLLFERPTIAALADAIEPQRTGSAGVQTITIPLADRSRPLLLSYAQERLWFLDQLGGGDNAYNMPMALRLRGALQVPALERSLQAIVQRHENLRTTFVLVDGQPVQKIHSASFTLTVLDLSALPVSEQETERNRLLQAEVNHTFDLTQGPLFRAILVRLSPFSNQDESASDHLLLFNLHHIVSDGWSIQRFNRELETLYCAFVKGQPSPLADLPIQYADFALWQRQWLADASMSEQLAYWQQRLQGAPPLLALPTDRPRPPVQSHKGAHYPFVVPAALASQLQTLAQTVGATPFMTFLAAFKVLLMRYSGQSDIVVGSPIANRNHLALEPLIGFFINTLVLRSDLSGDLSFRDLLAQVKETTLDAYQHQDMPFEKIVEQLQPERNLSHSPLFQVMFDLLQGSSFSLDLPGLDVESVQVEYPIAKFDLSLLIVEAAIPEDKQCLLGLLEYNIDLFDRATIERMAGHFQTLLAGIVAAPDQRISELPLLTDAERQQLLVEWNDTTVNYPKDKCIHHLFEEQVERTPDAIAVVFESQKLTYRALNTRANQLAHYLHTLGVGPEVLVGICVERSIEMVVGLLGILKAGGAYVPLDPSYPQERLEFMLHDAEISILLTQAHLAGKFSHSHLSFLMDTDWDTIQHLPTSTPTVTMSAERLAYVIYTSGSTGQPKGVMIRHRNVSNLIHWHQAVYRLTPQDRATQVAGPAFDAVVWELWPALTAGAAIYIMDEGTRAAPERILQWWAEHAITLSFLPTPLAEVIVSLPLPNRLALRLLLTGGDLLHLHPPSTLPFTLVNNYGPTENTVVTTWVPLPTSQSLSPLPPIGKPIFNTQVYLLDGHHQLVPTGVTGELHIGGASLACGYLNRPELTQEKFIENPFGTGRLYKTGDLCRWLADGNIEYLGRIDQQVKIRGFRIELGEIETVLSQHPSVQEAIVIAREDTPGKKRLVAYLVNVAGYKSQVASDSTLQPTNLRGYLQSKLPEHMLPSAFVELDALPLTPNGKVDRKALPAPDLPALLSTQTFVAPRTSTEHTLADIWAAVLGLEQIGVEDNFFELGGHSLLATQVVSRIRQTLNVEIPLRLLFEHPTVATLADALDSQLAASARVEAQIITPVDRNQALPLSYAQERLWFLDQLGGDRHAYNMPIALRLIGELKIAALEQSLQELVRRHESLRTTFAPIPATGSSAENESGERRLNVVQVIQPAVFTLPILDLTALAADAQVREVQRLMAAEMTHTFDLTTGPLFRVTLVRLRQGQGDEGQPATIESLLLLNMHHIISDGWSMEIFNRELTALYMAFREGKPSPLPPLTIQYADFAVWQRQQLAGEALAGQLAYWQKQLAGAPPLLTLPTDHPRPAVQTYRGNHLFFSLPKALTDEVRRLSNSAGTTLFMTCLAAFKVLLMRYSGQTDIVVGTPIANRHHLAIEPLIGFFVNTLVLRSEVAGELSFRDLLAQVKKSTLDAYQHQDVPFEKLVDTLHPVRSLSHTPLFQVMFDLLKSTAWRFELPELRMEPVTDVEFTTAKFDLTLSLVDDESQWQGMFEYNSDLFERATIERMAGHFETLLQAIVDNPDQPIGQLPLLSTTERHQLLVEWNNTTSHYPQDKTIHQLFEEQVARTPNAIAVVMANGEESRRLRDWEIDRHFVQSPNLSLSQSLTYVELNARANQLAHHLQTLGVGPEVLVGICVERSLEMIIGLLGILKAGGAYVPLDPSYPQERLEFMLHDAQVALVLTQTKFLHQLPCHATQPLCLDGDWSLIAQQCAENLTHPVNAAHLAYVIYTSGSTGTPKGVMVEHRSVVNHNLAVTKEFGLSPEDRVLQFSTINFDAAVEEIFPTLLVGATLVLRDNTPAPSATALLQLIEKYRLTVLDLPTVYWQAWVFDLALTQAPIPPSLRLVILGGDKVSPERIATWNQCDTAAIRLLNTYGPTEATIIATTYEATTAEKRSITPVDLPIGRPIANTYCYILDANQQPVPLGVIGELYIGGAGVARGYLNRSELTAEKFLVDPFCCAAAVSVQGTTIANPTARMYRTGDFARYRMSDAGKYLIEFVGRVDNQVKIQGFRVELGEIETLLQQHPDVQEAVVLAHEGESTLGAGEKHLVAYVVQRTREQGKITTLYTYLQARLPSYMRPATIVLLDALPLLPSGKIDRRTLLAIKIDDMGDLRSAQGDANGLVLPRTPTEAKLAEIWQQLLHYQQIGVHDNFFRAGGDSILSLQLVSRARQMGIQLAPQQIFQYQTIAELAQLVDAQSAENVSADGQSEKVQPWTLANQALVTGSAPLTPIQQMWAELNLLNPNIYNQTMLIEIAPTVQPELLRQALQILLRHHDALRFRYRTDSKGWLQFLNPPTDELFLLEIETSGLSQPAFQARAAEALLAVERTINLTNGPLTGLALLHRQDGEQSYLIWSTHHLVVDYVSWRILLADLESVYQQLRHKQVVQLPAKTTSFQQWALWLEERGTTLVASEVDYWVAQFQDIQPLPLDFPAGEPTWASLRTVSAVLPVAETQMLLQQAPATYDTQINDLLLTALLQTFAGWTQEQNLLIELEGHGREPLEQLSEAPLDLSRSVGWFTTAYPLRLSCSTDDLGTLIQSVRRQLRQVSNRGLGYGILRYLQQEPRLASFTMPIIFNYLGQFDPPTTSVSRHDTLLRSSGMDWTMLGSAEVENPSEFAKQNGQTLLSNLFDLELMVIGGQLKVIWLYSQNVHTQQTVQHLLDQFMMHLRILIEHCCDRSQPTLSSFKNNV